MKAVWRQAWLELSGGSTPDHLKLHGGDIQFSSQITLMPCNPQVTETQKPSASPPPPPPVPQPQGIMEDNGTRHYFAPSFQGTT